MELSNLSHALYAFTIAAHFALLMHNIPKYLALRNTPVGSMPGPIGAPLDENGESYNLTRGIWLANIYSIININLLGVMWNAHTEWGFILGIAQIMVLIQPGVVAYHLQRCNVGDIDKS